MMTLKRFLTSGTVALLLAAQSFAGTVTGVQQNAQGGPVANGTYTFQLTAPATIAGVASIATSTVNCYTDASGNVVGEPNPLVLPITSVNLSSGTLAAGNYFVKIWYFDGSGNSFPSPEVSVNLASPGTLTILSPIKQPANASGYRVGISTVSGSETLQGSVAGTPGSWVNFSQSVPLTVPAAAAPVSNTTVCSLHFNDEMTPSFVCYNVGLTYGANGASVPGYPQYWYLAGGANGIVNIANGTPQANVCQGEGTFYPQAILALPPFGTPQSIGGDLNIGGKLAAKCVNGVCDAANSTGADWCAKATNAAATLSGSVGKVTISAAAGQSVCAAALNIPSNVTVEFSQTGTWTVSCSGIVVSGTHIEIVGRKGTIITLPNSCANFSRPVSINSSTDVSIHGLEINGNGNNQAAGEQDANIIVFNSNQVKIWDNYLHDAQGDDINVNTDVTFNTGCNDILIQGNTFANIGRQMFTTTGYGCNDVRVLGNHFTYGTPVSTSTSLGNPIHIELDNAGSAKRITIASNDISGAVGTCISTTTPTGVTIQQLSITNNQCSMTNGSAANAAGIAVLQAIDVTVSGNHIIATGATAGSDGILFDEALGVVAAANRVAIGDNQIEGVTGRCVDILSSASSGTGQSVSVHDNHCNTITGNAIHAQNLFSDVDIHDNVLTNLQNEGIHVEAVARFHVHHNTIRDFGLSGANLNGIDITCNGLNTAVGPGYVDTNYIGSATTTSKIGIIEQCGLAAGIFTFGNNLTDNATSESFAGGGGTSGYTRSYPVSAQTFAPAGTGAAPGLAFIGDAGTGFSLPSAGAMFWSRAAVRQIGFFNNILRFGSGEIIGVSSAADPNSSTSDVNWTRKASGIWQAGNGESANANAFVLTGNKVFVTTDFTTANNTNLQTITGLSWTFPAAAANYSFHCSLLYSQATAAVADQFGIQAATNNPTNIAASALVYTSASASILGTVALLATTTATPLVTFTPSATGTVFTATLEGTLELAASANTINIMVQTSTGADAVTVKRGSYCELF